MILELLQNPFLRFF